MDWDVVVVGAGAAGLVAAERAATRGLSTLLLEKNHRPGVKILMSGGTRCNLTQATDSRGIVAAFGNRQGPFLHSALAALGPAELVALVEGEGVPTKVEETGKIFPVSNKATDVLGAFVRRFERSGAKLACDEPLESLESVEGGFALRTPSRSITTSRVIVTVGGKSYPGCGTRGDGYGWATALGHTIVALHPALTPITTDENWIHSLRGITIPDVQLTVMEPTGPASGDADASSGSHSAGSARRDKPRVLDTRRGSLLFAHFGLSGPVALDASGTISVHARPRSLRLMCDFLPALKGDDLSANLTQAASLEGKKQIASLMAELLPRRLTDAILARATIEPSCRAAELSRAARAALLAAVKQTELTITGTRGFEKAEVTAGGVDLSQVDSRTLESKLVKGLHWAGEVLDLDGPIGGYNFQAAFSTGWLAGMSV